MEDDSHENHKQTLKYVRRCDRTPDRKYYTLNKEDKKRVCFSRTAVNRVREKITRLEDEVNKRDQKIDQEKTLRKEAEAKLQCHLTDMFNSPDVNQELRERLPRSNKSDPFKREEFSETDQSSIEEQIVSEDTDGDEVMRTSRPDEGKPIEAWPGDEAGSHIAAETSSNLHLPKHNLNFSHGVKPHSKTNTETQTGAFERSNTFPFSNLTQSQGLYGAGPYSLFQSNSLNGTFQSPLLHPSTLTRHRSSPVLNTSLNSSYPTLSAGHQPFISRVQLSNAFTQQAAAASCLQGEISSLGEGSASCAIGDGLHGQHSLQSNLDSGARAEGSKTLLPEESSVHTSVLPDPFLPSGSPRLQMLSSLHPDQSKEIAILINHIDSQRAEVNKMRKTLAEKDLEIGMLKLTQNTQDAKREGGGSDAHIAAGIVEDVYAAQKKRDDATSRRVKIVNEERDDVMARLRQLERRLQPQNNRIFFNHSEDDLPLMEELLDTEDDLLLMSPSSADNSPSSVFHKVETMKERQRQVTQEEMQIVMEQRDVALARCQKLETELLQYQKESEADGGMDKTLKAKLNTVQQERDMAVAKSKQLEDEIQTIRLYYSLYKSLSSENTLQQQANHAVSSYQQELKISRHEVEHVLQENTQLVQDNNHMKKQLHTFTIDKKQLQKALQAVTQEKERFQRLVSVLRRKLNGLTDDNREEDKD